MRIRLLVLFVALVAAIQPASAQARNPQIAGLQVALRSYGLYCGAIDGVSGPATVRAVRAFQRRAGLSADGLAGPRTRAALGPLGGPLFGRRALGRGQFGWDVAVLQFLLVRHGRSPGPITGYFDARTASALRAYQRSRRLAADAVAGQATFAVLARESAVPLAPLVARAGARSRFVAHAVRPGETLTGLASRYGTSIGAIARANRLRPDSLLLAGAELRIPVVRVPDVPRASVSPALVRSLLDRWSARYGVDPHLARALAWMESGFQDHLTSSAGARGVLQLLPVTWRYVQTVVLGHPVPQTTEGNVRVGLVYLRELLREFAGDERLALAAWFQGSRGVRELGVLPQTEAFVADVLALKRRM